jgi:hypothetical protein
MDIKILSKTGNIAFYNSCEVTEIFLCRKSDKAIFNFFTLVVFEEKLYNGLNHAFLGDRIPINDDLSLGIQRYWLMTTEAETKFDTLRTQNKWSSDGTNFSQFPQLKYLSKQYIPHIDENRINKILKNNYHNGSYTIEFFDEAKSNLSFLLKIETLDKLNDICAKIKKAVPIDLSIVRDRIGNFIFQFPISIIDSHSKALPTWDGVDINISWHNSVTSIPDCLIQVESTFDKNYMGAVIEDYNKSNNQKIIIGNLDQINHIKIWRKEPTLILSSHRGSYIRDFDFNMSIISPEPRIFELNGAMQQIQVASSNRRAKKKKDNNYTTYINNYLYDAEKKQLEKTLSFKQYKNGGLGGIEDLQKLIQQKDENGVYIWDPFLSSTDILKTLFFSQTAGVPLKAIGSINDTVKMVYKKKGMSVSDIIAEYKAKLDNPNHNNHLLNLEFRIQYSNFGWAFHDRFLIFPSGELKRPQVYSLGTSLNSYGDNHHILQEVSHPQPVVDAFNELWDKLNNQDCLVWKFPK